MSDAFALIIVVVSLGLALLKKSRKTPKTVKKPAPQAAAPAPQAPAAAPAPARTPDSAPPREAPLPRPEEPVRAFVSLEEHEHFQTAQDRVPRTPLAPRLRPAEDADAPLREADAPDSDEWLRAVVMAEVLKRPNERRRMPYGR